MQLPSRAIGAIGGRGGTTAWGDVPRSAQTGLGSFSLGWACRIPLDAAPVFTASGFCRSAFRRTTASNAKAAKTQRARRIPGFQTASSTESKETQKSQRKAFQPDSLCVLCASVPSVSNAAGFVGPPSGGQPLPTQRLQRRKGREEYRDFKPLPARSPRRHRGHREKHSSRILSVFSVPLCPLCRMRRGFCRSAFRRTSIPERMRIVPCTTQTYSAWQASASA